MVVSGGLIYITGVLRPAWKQNSLIVFRRQKRRFPKGNGAFVDYSHSNGHDKTGLAGD